MWFLVRWVCFLRWQESYMPPVYNLPLLQPGNCLNWTPIAAAFVGGVSAAGGVGSVIGSLIGALVMTSLTNGMNLMGIDISYQYIVRAIVLAAAVIFDVTTRRTGK